MPFKRVFHNLRLIWLSLKIILKPNELQNVLNLAKILFSSGHLKTLKQHCAQRRPEMFVARPIFRPDLAKLSLLRPGTLGREYLEFLKKRAIDPQDLHVPNESYDRDELYLFEYFYQTHDLFHMLTGFETDVTGELELQAFYLGQAPTPLAPLLIGMGIIREFWLNPQQAQILTGKVCDGYQLGKRTPPMYGIDWDHELTKPISEVRQKLYPLDSKESA